jgi:sec1 family domain-containing protein 1
MGLVDVGTMPIIRCPKGNAAELISQRLDGKLRDYFMNSRGVASSAYSRPYQERPGITVRNSIDYSNGDS